VGNDWRNPARPGEHQFPMPSVDIETGRLKDWGKTWVRVAHLAQLPWWLLLDQRKVYLERDDRTTRYFSPREIREGKWYLTGREILQRVPLEKSFLMSVMGWPLAYIPLKYLVWLASGGEFSGPDAPQITVEHYPPKGCKTVQVWKFRPVVLRTGYYRSQDGNTLTIKHGQPCWQAYPMDVPLPTKSWQTREPACFGPLFPGPLKDAIYAYLESAEARDQLDKLGRDPDCEWSDFYPHGVWTDDVEAYKPAEIHETPRTWRIFTTGQPVKGVLLQAHELPTTYQYEAYRNRFSERDRDRFGPWYAHGRPVWLGTKGLVQEDIDPTPAEWRLGLLENGSNGRLQLWDKYPGSQAEEEPRDWMPPAAPAEELEALERIYRQQEWLERLAESWLRKWDQFRFDLSKGNLAGPDAEQFHHDRREVLDKLSTAWTEFVLQLWPALEDGEILFWLSHWKFHQAREAIQDGLETPPPPLPEGADPDKVVDEILLKEEGRLRIFNGQDWLSPDDLAAARWNMAPVPEEGE
jgi:hypothetical protein